MSCSLPLIVLRCKCGGRTRLLLPLVCSLELLKMKAVLEAGIQDVNRESVVRSFVLSIVASLEDGSLEAAAGVPAVTSDGLC
jgi:hypothetical protein